MLTFREFLTEADEEVRIDPKTFSLQNLFNELNTTLFGSKLESDIPATWGKTPKGAAGITRYKILTMGRTRAQRIHNSETVEGSITIIINPYTYRLDVLKGVLTHEMIHAYNAQENEHHHDYHGYYFMRKLNEIQPKVSFKIPLKHSTEDEEHGAPKPVGFIVGQKHDGTEVASLFSPRAFADPKEHVTLKSLLNSLSNRMQWASGGIGTSVLANTLVVQRKIGRNMTVYRVKNSMITPKTIITSIGTAPTEFKSNEPIS